MNKVITQDPREGRLKTIVGFINENYVTPEEVSELIKALANVINTKFDTVNQKIDSNSAEIIQQSKSAVASTKIGVENLITSQSKSTDQKLTLLETKVVKTIHDIAAEIRKEMPDIPDMPEVDEKGIVNTAVQKSYDVIRPLIPNAETPESVRAKLDLSLLFQKIDAKYISNLEEHIDISKLKLPPAQIIHVHDRGGSAPFIETPLKDATTGRFLSKDASGAWLISASGGGLNQETPAESPDATIKTFTFTNLPKFILTDTGIWLDTFNYSTSGSGPYTITPFAPVQQWIRSLY